METDITLFRAQWTYRSLKTAIRYITNTKDLSSNMIQTDPCCSLVQTDFSKPVARNPKLAESENIDITGSLIANSLPYHGKLLTFGKDELLGNSVGMALNLPVFSSRGLGFQKEFVKGEPVRVLRADEHGPPKRFYRTFWRGISKRILQISSVK